MPKKTQQKPTSLDQLIDNAGLGVWNYIVFCVAMLNVSSYAVNLVVAQFSAPALPFSCADPSEDPTLNPVTGTQCFVSRIVNDSEFKTQPCRKFVFDHSVYHSTVTSTFELVCDRSYLLSLYQILITLGFSTGALFGGAISEKYGRARSAYMVLVLLNLAIMANIFSPWLSVMMVARFVTGFCGSISVNALYTLALECCPRDYRPIFGTFYGLPYAISIIVLGGVGYLIRDWQILTGIMYSPMYIILIIGNPWFVSESPRWLLSKNRLEEAEQVIRRAYKLNGKTSELPEKLDILLNEIYQRDFDGNSMTIIDRFKSLLKSKDMRLLAAQQGILWLLLGILYACIPLSVGDFKSPFLTMALLGLSEVPAYSAVAPITAAFGRRTVIAGGLLAGGVLFFIDVVIQFSVPAIGPLSDWLHMGMAALTCVMLCTAWQVANTHRVELFPTTVCSVASTVTYSAAGLGCSVPPLLDSAVEMLPEYLRWTKQVAYALLAFVALSIVLRLQETMHKPLSSNVKEYSNGRNQDKLARYNRKINKILNNLDPSYLAEIEKDIQQYNKKTLEGNATEVIPPIHPTLFTIEREFQNDRSI